MALKHSRIFQGAKKISGFPVLQKRNNSGFQGLQENFRVFQGSMKIPIFPALQENFPVSRAPRKLQGFQDSNKFFTYSFFKLETDI